jgi:hypothetical protein
MKYINPEAILPILRDPALFAGGRIRDAADRIISALDSLKGSQD